MPLTRVHSVSRSQRYKAFNMEMTQEFSQRLLVSVLLGGDVNCFKLDPYIALEE